MPIRHSSGNEGRSLDIEVCNSRERYRLEIINLRVVST